MAEQNATSAFAERRVDVDSFTIRYLATSPQTNGTEPLICIHGAGGLRLSPMHEMLAKTHRVVAFETPGFGASPINERSRDMAELAATLCTAIAALGIRSYHLMGTSFGGKLATHMALQDGEKIQSLTLLSPAVFRPTERPPMETPEQRRKHGLQLLSEAKELTDYTVCSLYERDPKLLRFLHQAGIEPDGAVRVVQKNYDQTVAIETAKGGFTIGSPAADKVWVKRRRGKA